MGTEGFYIGAAISLIASAVSTGMTVYGQQQQADQAEAMANYNYAIQQQNAKVNQEIALQQATINQRAAMSQHQAGLSNVQAYYDQAAATDARGREEARRMRSENDRFLAVQRANYAKSGVTISEGSPLLVMAETAGNLELGVQDALYQSNQEAASLRRAGEMERYQAGFSLMDAGVQAYEAAAARAGYKLNLRQAELDRMSGYSQAAGLRMNSYATLISGAAQVADTGFNYYTRLPTKASQSAPNQINSGQKPG